MIASNGLCCTIRRLGSIPTGGDTLSLEFWHYWHHWHWHYYVFVKKKLESNSLMSIHNNHNIA